MLFGTFLGAPGSDVAYAVNIHPTTGIVYVGVKIPETGYPYIGNPYSNYTGADDVLLVGLNFTSSYNNGNLFIPSSQLDKLLLSIAPTLEE